MLHQEARTLMSYKSALKDPLLLGFDLVLNKRIYSMFVKTTFNKRPMIPEIIPQWSINHSLETIKFQFANTSYKTDPLNNPFPCCLGHKQ